MLVSASKTAVLAMNAMIGEPIDKAREAQPAAVVLLNSEFDVFYSAVYRYLLHRAFDREAAEELTAETFYKAATFVRKLRADRHELRMWLLRVATNLANSHCRKQQWRQRLFGRWAKTNTRIATGEQAAQSVVEQCRERVHAAVQALPAPDQAIIALRYYTQLSYEDITEILGCRADAVRARLSRALKRLRERLQDNG